MKIFSNNMMIITAVALSLLSGCRKTEAPEANAEAPKETSVSVMVYHIQPESISRYLTLTGGLEAGDETLVYSETTEKLETIKVEVGDQVKANQVLAVQSGRTLQESVRQAEAALKNAEAEQKLSQQNYTRTAQLYHEQILSKQDFDEAETEVETAKSAVEEAQAALAQAREEQGDTLIRAPFAGKVAQIFFNKGDMVSSGEAVFRIVNTKTFKATLDVPETDTAYVALGQNVIATFPAIPETEFSGKITRVDEAIDPDKRALEIEVSFANSDAEQDEKDQKDENSEQEGAENEAPRQNIAVLRSGQFGQFRLEVEHYDKVVVIPDNAVITQTEVDVDEQGKQLTFKTHYVYVVEQGKATKRVVTTGTYSSGRVEITSGLNVGDTLIVTGQNVVKEGNPVNIKNQQTKQS